MTPVIPHTKLATVNAPPQRPPPPPCVRGSGGGRGSVEWGSDTPDEGEVGEELKKDLISVEELGGDGGEFWKRRP